MGHSVKLSKDKSHIILKVTSDFKAQDMMEYIIEAHAMGEKLGINHFLVDVTEAKNIDSLFDNYKFAYSDIRKADGFNQKARVVALVNPDDHSHDFIETVLCNAGLPIKLFTEFDMAIDYLRDQ